MKLLIAIIRPTKLEAVREALRVIGVERMTVCDAHGYGRQRGQTETYRGVEYSVNLLRKVPPRKLGYRLAWLYNVAFIVAVYTIAQKAPRFSRRAIRAVAKHYLPEGYPVDTHFKPTYDPWDQRLCLILSGDFYDAIAQRRADVVTDQVDHFDAGGVVLKSGDRIDADVVVTATGLQLQALGGVALRVDGAEVKPADRFVYKEHLLEDVPNLAWCVGYINASWTLRADLTARAVAKLLAYMDSHGYTHAYPHLGSTSMEEKPAWNINAGYVRRAAHVLPKSGTHRPWNVRHNYVLDAIDHRFDRMAESMVFGRAAVSDARPDTRSAPGAPKLHSSSA